MHALTREILIILTYLTKLIQSNFCFIFQTRWRTRSTSTCLTTAAHHLPLTTRYIRVKFAFYVDLSKKSTSVWDWFLKILYNQFKIIDSLHRYQKEESLVNSLLILVKRPIVLSAVAIKFGLIFRVIYPVPAENKQRAVTAVSTASQPHLRIGCHHRLDSHHPRVECPSTTATTTTSPAAASTIRHRHPPVATLARLTSRGTWTWRVTPSSCTTTSGPLPPRYLWARVRSSSSWIPSPDRNGGESGTTWDERVTIQHTFWKLYKKKICQNYIFFRFFSRVTNQITIWPLSHDHLWQQILRWKTRLDHFVKIILVQNDLV